MSLFLYLYVMDINDIIEKFNNNDLNVEKYFNDYETFFNMLKKRGRMGDIDPNNADNGGYWQNDYLLWLYENDRENYYKWIQTLLNDVVIENGNAYLELSDRGDLARLFCKNDRNGLSRDSVESILNGDSDWEPYYNTTDDVYSDVIEELTPENDKRLQEYIVNILEGQEVTGLSDELQLIASEQGHPDYVEVNMENVKRIVDDKESMNELLNGPLDELKSELFSIHSSAYNGAYQSEIYGLIWSELDIHFVGRVIDEQTKIGETTKWLQYVKIRDLQGNVEKFLSNRLGSEYNEDKLDYEGSYTTMMKRLMDDGEYDWLDFRIPDYPDYGLVTKDINDIFGDYI